jgi:hypothetical protein
MANRDIHLCKSSKEVERDSRDLDIGVGDNMIPNKAKNQRMGFNSKGGIGGYSHSKKTDAFRKQNRGKDFGFSI